MPDEEGVSFNVPFVVTDPDRAFVPEHDVALLVLTVSVVLWPSVMVVGFAVMDTVGAGVLLPPELPPLAPPLLPASTYVSQGEPDPARGYGRAANPGWDAVEDALAAIEGPGTAAVTFPSGQAASMALMLALAPGRVRIAFPDDGYYNTRAMAARLRPHGARAAAVDILDPGAVAAALADGPAVLWAETPTNPLLRVADLAGLGELAKAHGAPFVVDNTVATALLQTPLSCGAIASVYSLTKTLSGHSDVLGGAVDGLARVLEAGDGVRGVETDADRGVAHVLDDAHEILGREGFVGLETQPHTRVRETRGRGPEPRTAPRSSVAEPFSCAPPPADPAAAIQWCPRAPCRHWNKARCRGREHTRAEPWGY